MTTSDADFLPHIARQLRDALAALIPDMLTTDVPLETIQAVRAAVNAYDSWLDQQGK
jgi:hypothetical protein